MAPRPTAFVVPARTFALDLQRCRNASHTPTAAQQIHIYKPADALRAQQIKFGTLSPKTQNPGLQQQTGAF